uniref:RsiV family protein n=1 Tax=Bordetella sputigena TaxID=1416810 RepID=UPI0039F09FCC
MARLGAGGMMACALALLAACGSSPPADISLASPGAPAADAGDVKVESVKWTKTKPGCSGDCPRIEVDSVAFPGIPKLTALVDHVLAYMTGLDRNRRGQYETLNEYAQYFFQTAQSRDQTWFKASVKDTVGDIIAIELHTGQYVTGAAHPIPATQYMNWERSKGRVLALGEAILPGRGPQYVEALKAAHARWLKTNDDYKRDPAAYNKMWPYEPTDNFALTRDGMVVKYDAYSIAPYSYGEPELLIPYKDLVGILRPEFIPTRN